MGGRHRDGQESDSESALSEASVPSSKRTCTGDTSDVSDLEDDLQELYGSTLNNFASTEGAAATTAAAQIPPAGHAGPSMMGGAAMGMGAGKVRKKRGVDVDNTPMPRSQEG